MLARIAALPETTADHRELKLNPAGRVASPTLLDVRLCREASPPPIAATKEDPDPTPIVT
jgi:hypothetical protein